MQTVLIAVGVYLLLGLLFGVVFLVRGLTRVDPAAEGSSLAFRILILPGVAALWPVMALKWSRVRSTVIEEAPS